MSRRFLILSSLLFLGPISSGAAQLSVATANPPEGGVHELAEQFQEATGTEVRVETMGTAGINALLASGGPADVVIGTVASLDAAEGEDRLAGAPTTIGRVGIAVIVREGAPEPDVSSVETLVDTARGASGLIYNTAGSGRHVEGMFESLGLADEVRGKSARPSNAAETVARVVSGTGNEVGFGLVSEMLPYVGNGIRIVGRLPEEVQYYVAFEAVRLASSGMPEAADALIAFLTTDMARAVFRRHGLDAP